MSPLTTLKQRYVSHFIHFYTFIYRRLKRTKKREESNHDYITPVVEPERIQAEAYYLTIQQDSNGTYSDVIDDEIVYDQITTETTSDEMHTYMGLNNKDVFVFE